MKYALLLVGTLTSLLSFAQNDWHTFYDQPSGSLNSFFEKHGKELGLSDNSTMKLVDSQTDELGIVHQTYQQMYAGIPVYAGIMKLHQRGSKVTANGKIHQNLNLSTSSGLTSEEAIQSALHQLRAEKYAWQSVSNEMLLQRISKNPDTTNYPSPVLMVLPSENDFKLVWEMKILALTPHFERQIFVDAQSGEIVDSIELTCTHNSIGSGTTRYSGSQTFNTDSISASYYRLRDYSRGGGIETYNALEFESADLPDSAADFIDFTNTWMMDDSINQDDAALDVHWGLQQSYDYFFNDHGRDSWDGDGITMIAYVHVGSGWFNARFNGRWMEFGDGTGHPLTSLDVVAHEMTHGVTRSSAGLIYRNESGALNESFSDIFGAEVEFMATPAMADYFIGRENFTFRDMSAPNDFGHPDTYGGTHYYVGPADNGGVHINSGVQNFWYYLLVEGGSGTNDLGLPYSVLPLGHTEAAQIAYRNLNFYLTPGSTFLDARQGALAAAEDLFGSCSFQVDQVLAAWYAVGVGADTISPDFQILSVSSPNTDCDLTSNEAVNCSFRFLKSGCNHIILPGETIELGYSVNGIPLIENFSPGDTIFGGDTINYTFTNAADLSGFGSYEMKVWLNYSNDSRPDNDSITDIAISHPIRVENEKLTFENSIAVMDSFYTVTNDHSLVGVAIFGNPDPGGVNGLRMTGDDPDHDRDFEIPSGTADVWNHNPDYFAATCFCVDATSWPSAHLNFDMKQTFSKWYLQEYGFDLPTQASTLRLSVDGTPISGNYHPTTYISDPYESYHFDLSAYAGTQFELCFETMNFMKFEEDYWPGSEGDNAYLDNIWIGQSPAAISKNPLQNVSVYPNPASESVYITGIENGFVKVELTDALGRVVKKVTSNNNSTLQIKTSSLHPGLYLIHLQQNGFSFSHKILVQ